MEPLQEVTAVALERFCGCCRKTADKMIIAIRKHTTKGPDDMLNWRDYANWAKMDYMDVLFLVLTSRDDKMKFFRELEKERKTIDIESKYGGIAKLIIPDALENEKELDKFN